MEAATAWHIRGSYFESCNCDPICPCRRIDGVSGGRSTHGICASVLTWRIDEGEAAGIDLAGLPVARAIRYDDDEPGSPWTWILYLDEGASEEQQEALEAIFTGRLGGDALEHFPWAWKASHLVGANRGGALGAGSPARPGADGRAAARRRPPRSERPERRPRTKVARRGARAIGVS